MRYAKSFTLNDLRVSGKSLEVSCENCTRRSHVDTEKLIEMGDLPISRVAATLKCPTCGARNTPTRFPLYVRAVGPRAGGDTADANSGWRWLQPFRVARQQ